MIENKKKLNLISLGCAKNLVDSEILLGGLKKQVSRLPKILKKQKQSSSIPAGF